MSLQYPPLDDDRAVSVAVNHVLAIGITTILISGLMVSMGGLLDGQTKNAMDRELRSVGNRLADQLVRASLVSEKHGGAIRIRGGHTSSIVGSTYTVHLLKGTDDCDAVDTDACLVLSSTSPDREVTVPLGVDAASVTESEVSGGDVVILYDDAGLRIVDESDTASLGPGVDVPVGADVDLVPIERPGSGGGAAPAPGGGGGSGSPPSIDSYTLTPGTGQRLSISATFTDADSDLSKVSIFVNTTGGTNVESYSVTLSGSSDSLTDYETTNLNNGQTYYVKLVVYDANGNKDVTTRSEIA